MLSIIWILKATKVRAVYIRKECFFLLRRENFILELLKIAEKLGKQIASLKEAARKVGIPIVYVNDNFGKWKSDFRNVIKNVIEENKPGKNKIQRRSFH